ncbi:MAG: glycosyltransferase family 2 protein [Carboxylicivirga sp.]|jgi:dolichol-phosphate mannosyltransferase|nr:glycosyltransferase family 2 protein [Carboxylicivirga sp.]
MSLISIVIPLYNCAPFIEEMVSRISTVFTKESNPYEIIFVNDNSPSNDWEIVQKLASDYQQIKGINLSRNFGQHSAITAGLENASGDWVVVMDGDLQDQPEEIINLLDKAEQGYHIVFAKRVIRKDNFIKRMSSKFFYKSLAYLTGTVQNEEIANFGIYHRKVIDAILNMKDYTRYFPTMVKWVGFKSTSIEVKHACRSNGSSGYSFKALMNLAINTILSFSDKPLRLTVKLGISISCISFVFALYTLYRNLTHQITVSGYSSLIISIWLLAGIVITLLGMVGLYIGRIFDQVKNRPTYIISETINLQSNDRFFELG